jgi:hypothetical protein
MALPSRRRPVYSVMLWFRGGDFFSRGTALIGIGFCFRATT